MPASKPTLVAALAALTAAACTACHLHRMRRALHAERAARRLVDTSHHHDLRALVEAMHRRLAVEAGLVTTAPTTEHWSDLEGGDR